MSQNKEVNSVISEQFFLNKGITKFKLDSFAENNQRTLYVHGAFYTKGFNDDHHMYNEVNLCFHDHPAYTQNYFYSGDKGFFKDWDAFVDYVDQNNLGSDSFNFGLMSYQKVMDTTDSKPVKPEEDYVLKYEMKLFDSYDGNPIKIYDTKISQVCEVYMGQYFMSKYVRYFKTGFSQSEDIYIHIVHLIYQRNKTISIKAMRG